jgi:putative peptide zinc metalloprotease protein
VIQDPASGRNHRLGPNVYYLIALMDGSRSVSEIWNAALTHLGDDAPSQAELILLLSQLHTGDLLQCDVTPDTAEVFQRFSKSERSRWISRLANPMFARIPLWDPDEWLCRWLPVVEKLFKPWVLVVWLAVVGYSLLETGVHWGELSAPGLSSVLDPMNLVILFLSYPLVKILHELGHAFATRFYGGEVHEVGVMFLLMVPMPYVDASASSSFGSKWQRITVASAGVMVELFISALALLLWLQIAPGLLRSVLWNIMLIGGASTLLFNGNPLLRFDGYYVLADFLEIPNFAGRATQYLRYLFEHYVLGLPERRRMWMARGEPAWFVIYGITSWIYRLGITVGIALFLAGQFFFVGVLLALWGLALQLLLPAVRGIAELRRDPRVQESRLRTAGMCAGLAAAAVLVVFVMPWPAWSTFEGVVWIPERSQVRAGTAGFVRRIAVRPGTTVTPGQVLIETEDPLLDARVRVLEASLEEARTERIRERGRSVASARIVDDEIARLEAELATARARAAQGAIRSPESGRFVSHARDLPGRFVERGDLLGYVASFVDPTVRAVVPQADIAWVRARTKSIKVRLAESPGRILPATLRNVVPTATDQLPSMALGAGGGGAVAVDARDPEGLTATEPFFHVDLALPSDTPLSGIGGRVFVRFDFEAEPLFWRALRGARRLFMGELGV